MAPGIHHLYVETKDWNRSVAFWKALGFLPVEGWGGGDAPDGILAPEEQPMPYVFLREVPTGNDPLAFEVVLTAPDLDAVANAEGVVVDRARHASGWGPELLLVRDPDGRVLTVREDPG
jgi:catechol 2,3-dioxygenase-like lactoylglutathione lyase family enzyme